MEHQFDKSEIIKTAYEAQHDAGSLAWFRVQVKKASEDTAIHDPVVVALSNAMKGADDLQDVSMSLQFYSNELKRAADAVKRLHESKCGKEA